MYKVNVAGQFETTNITLHALCVLQSRFSYSHSHQKLCVVHLLNARCQQPRIGGNLLKMLSLYRKVDKCCLRYFYLQCSHPMMLFNVELSVH